ncbi:MAG TPA: DUF4347 domain-containing protein [Coleofasciculaceae cyanobacterium]|jgi:predicted outer membrane repeat protein
MTLSALLSTDRSVVFIDRSVADFDALAAGLQPNAQAVLLDATQDGITQITQVLQGASNISSLQIIAHGETGTLHLGNAKLNAQNCDRYAAQIQQWRSALSTQANILLYACAAAADVDPEDATRLARVSKVKNSSVPLIDRLSQLTGAAVAASRHAIGNGNWNLEVATGEITARPALTAATLATYAGQLAIVTVSNTADKGAGSLRAAIGSAKAGDTIKFAASLANKTIKLTSGQIELAIGKSLTIDGTGAANLTISGNSASRIFYVNSNQDRPITLNLKNITLADAYVADQGGAIKGEHKAVINIEGVKFKNNTADKGGGAIYCAWENSLTVTGSQFNGNKAIAGNDERGAGAIAFVSPGAITLRNSQFTNNRGINGAAVNSLNGKLTVDNCKFINNDTNAATYGTGANPFLRGYGGAIYTDRANDAIVITKSTFQGNSAKASGGAVHLFADPEDVISIEGSLFTNNKATGLPGGQDKGKGGAITQIRNSTDPRGKFTIANSTIANNEGYDQGGGLWVNNARTTITNSTFSGNKLFGDGFSNVGGGMTLYSDTDIINTTIANNFAGWVGGGISAVDAAKVTVQNTIFYKNTAKNGTANYGIQQHTSRELTDNGGNIQFPPKKTNNFNDYNATAKVRLIDPKLGELQDNGGGLPTHALLSGSPAINTGVSNGSPATDERGIGRTDGKIDVGAFEFSGSPSAGGGDRLTGTATADTLTGGAGNDTLLGGLGGDAIAGKAGSDRFLYSGSSQRLAFSQSLINAPDRLTDFNLTQKDKIQLDYDDNLATAQRPKALFHAGKVSGSLGNAAKAAFADKNRAVSGRQTLAAQEAVFFQRGTRTYLAVNDSQKGFQGDRDLLLDLTGIRMVGQTAGVLKVRDYFA